jgi:hypothetical protein
MAFYRISSIRKKPEHSTTGYSPSIEKEVEELGVSVEEAAELAQSRRLSLPEAALMLALSPQMQ